MTIYQSGNSVKQQLFGNSAKNTNFVCVLDFPQEYSIELGYLEMVNYITQALKRTIVSKDCHKFAVTIENGDTYTLANCFTIQEDKLFYEPANILRHIFSQILTVDSLYIDEDGEIVDLTQKGVKDVLRYFLRTQHKEISKIININPDIAIDILEERFNNGDAEISDDLYSCLANLNPINHINNFNKLQNILDKKGISFIREIERYRGLHNYLTNSCGMKLSVTFDLKAISNNETNNINPCAGLVVAHMIVGNLVPMIDNLFDI